MKNTQSDRFKTTATLGIVGGIVTMVIGGSVTKQDPDLLLVGVALSLGGWALLIWGCVNYMRWKGYLGWFGLFGYLLLPGLIILACFPNRRKVLQAHDSEQVAQAAQASQSQVLTAEDRRSGRRFLLTLMPLAVIFVSLSGLLTSSQSNIEAAEWQEVDSVGFHSLMPGTPRLEQETTDDKLELHKFIVKPKGKNELFMIVAIRFPEEMANQLGGPEKLLELGRQDIVVSQGQLQSERQIFLGNLPGLELEVLPPKGAIIKARIFATKTQIYQVLVHVPKIRLTSEDVKKFLESFRLSATPGRA